MAKSPTAILDASKIVLPVSYAAWLAGDMGRAVERSLRQSLKRVPRVKVSRLPRALLVEADEDPGPLLEAVRRAALDLEQGVQETFPVFHHEFGPLWTGTLQAVFPQAA